MAELIIQNPSITSGDFSFSGDAITAIAGHPVAGVGGGDTQSDYVYVPSFNSETGDLTFNLGVTGTEGKGPWHISGATGPQGEQGIQGETGPAGADGSNGADGKTPELRINPSNAEWQWKYTVDNDWINLGVTASGAVGPQGQSGASGASGISPTVTTAAIPGEDGTRVTFTYGPGDDSTYIDVMNGAAGASGESGYSPTITTATTADAQHPQSGVNVTVTDIDGNKSFNIWNGIDGQGATVNLLEGDGIQITHNGTDYTIGVSADYALKSELPDVSDMATETWVGNQGFLKNSESDLRYMQKTTDNTLSGNGTTNSPLGLDMTNAYTIDGINGITAVPDATSNKVIVKMTDDAWGYYQHLAASASEWDKISGLSAKSNVNITSAGITTVTNTSGTTENKFTQYAEVASHPTPRMFLCATADTVADISGVLTAASGMGAVVFVIESHS